MLEGMRVIETVLPEDEKDIEPRLVFAESTEQMVDKEGIPAADMNIEKGRYSYSRGEKRKQKLNLLYIIK